MMASIVVIFTVAGYGGWYALGKPDFISSIMQDAPPEIAAAPQVETTVTEPDDPGSADVGPKALAETAPMAVEGAGVVNAPQEPDVPEVMDVLPPATVADTDNAGAQPPVPQVGLDDPAAYEAYTTRFYRDSRRNPFQIYINSRDRARRSRLGGHGQCERGVHRSRS